MQDDVIGDGPAGPQAGPRAINFPWCTHFIGPLRARYGVRSSVHMLGDSDNHWTDERLYQEALRQFLKESLKESLWRC